MGWCNANPIRGESVHSIEHILGKYINVRRPCCLPKKIDRETERKILTRE